MNAKIEKEIKELAKAYVNEFGPATTVDGEWAETGYNDFPADEVTYDEYKAELDFEVNQLSMSEIDFQANQLSI